MNDGGGTRINITTGKELALDLSNPLAGISNWPVSNNTTVGSDYYPVSCSVGEQVEIRPGEGILKWGFRRADWVKFQQLTEESLSKIVISGNLD